MLRSLTMTSLRMKRPGIAGLILAISFTLIFSLQARAESQPTPTPTPTPIPTPKPPPVIMTVKSVQPYTSTPGEAGMGEWIVVEVNNLAPAVKSDGIDPRAFVLYLNGRPLQGVTGLPIESNKLAFQLKRTDASREAWSTLLGRPGFQNHVRPVTVSVGSDKQSFAFEDPSKPPQMNLRVYHPWWAVGSLVVLILLVIYFIYKAKTSNIIRDSNPPQPPVGDKKPYSLALTQAAWWFFLVIGSFIFIYLITGDYNTITEQALILMGIGIGTALGATMIDATKRDTAGNELSGLRPRQAALAAEVQALNARKAELESKITAAGATPNPADQLALRDVEIAISEKQTNLEETAKKIEDAAAGLSSPVSTSFRNDLFTDVNGLSLHRFQMGIWTVVLGVLFLIGVYKELAMPEFSTTMLALMGISAGTYLGFKIPEKQTKP